MSLEWSDWRKLLGPGSEPVSRILKVCEQRGFRLALVGGGVRDLLMGRELRDLDLVVEGSAPEVASAVCNVHGGTTRVHARFGTATWRNAQGIVVDLATARSETYPHSGSLPVVQAASLEADLARRDFSINAMALVLAQDRVDLLDPHGGRADLQHRRLVLLHAQSLVDDPTRIWRGVRFVARLNLELGATTSEWWNDALAQDYLNRVSLQRIGAEVHRLFAENNRHQVWRVARRWGLWERISADLTDAESWAEWLNVDSDPVDPSFAVSWLALAAALSASERERLLALVPGTGSAQKRWLHGPERVACAAAEMNDLEPQSKSSVVARIIEDLDEIELQLLVHRSNDVVAHWVDWWRLEGRLVRTSVTGQGFIERGFAPGPHFAVAKAAALNAARDGENDEEQWERALLAMGEAD